MNKPLTSLSLAPSSDRRRDAWYWRLFATGVAFILFAMGCMVLRILAFMPRRWRGADTLRQKQRARVAISRSMRMFISFLVRTGVMTFEFNGAERLGRPGQMIIANHPSLLDVVFLLAQVRHANCIIKHGLIENPITYGPVSAAGYISNETSLDMFEASVKSLTDGETLVVFPEGTRSQPGQAPVFHRGACAIALRGARVVTPVIIRHASNSLAKGQPWYHIPKQRLHYVLDVGTDIDPQHWADHHSAPIAGRKMNEFLHTYFRSELGLNGPT